MNIAWDTIVQGPYGNPKYLEIMKACYYQFRNTISSALDFYMFEAQAEIQILNFQLG
jgi:hypothetical protein